jgi:hypothetical protein
LSEGSNVPVSGKYCARALVAFSLSDTSIRTDGNCSLVGGFAVERFGRVAKNDSYPPMHQTATSIPNATSTRDSRVADIIRAEVQRAIFRIIIHQGRQNQGPDGPRPVLSIEESNTRFR